MDYEKILFRFYSDIFEEEIVETMWAFVIEKEKGLFRLDSIPFYAKLIAPDDIIYAEFDESEQMLTYRKTVEYSGNSVVQVFVLDEKVETNEIRNLLVNLGCLSEKVNDKYFTVEVLQKTNYNLIKTKLEQLENENIIEYAESCLSEKHKLESQ